MEEAPILICYDGTEGSDRAIETAAALLGPGHAVVLDIGPPLTTAESLATISPVVPGQAFEDLNTADALSRAVGKCDRPVAGPGAVETGEWSGLGVAHRHRQQERSADASSLDHLSMQAGTKPFHIEFPISNLTFYSDTSRRIEGLVSPHCIRFK